MFTLALLLALTVPPTPTDYVTDKSGVLSQDTIDRLDDQLDAYQKKTGHEVIVYVAPSTGGEPLESFTSEAGHTWKVGNAGKDDGAILFVFTKDRAVRIEVGYGFEGQLTDAKSKEIAHNDIAPKLTAGDYDGAVIAGVSDILRVVSPGSEPDATSSSRTSAPSSTSGTSKTPGWQSVLFLIAALLVLFAIFAIISAIVGLIAMIFRGPQAFWPTFWTTFRVLEWVLIIFGSSNRRGNRTSSGSDRSFSSGGGDFGGGGASDKF